MSSLTLSSQPSAFSCQEHSGCHTETQQNRTKRALVLCEFPPWFADQKKQPSLWKLSADLPFFNPSPWQPESQPVDHCNCQTPAPQRRSDPRICSSSAQPPHKGECDRQLFPRAHPASNLLTEPRRNTLMKAHPSQGSKTGSGVYCMLINAHPHRSSCRAAVGGVSLRFQHHTGGFELLSTQGGDAASPYLLVREALQQKSACRWAGNAPSK